MDKVKKILIITSDESLKKILNFCFDGWGYEVFLHDAPFNDINYIKKIAPDAIVVDASAANKADLLICKNVKEDIITAFIPVITLINKRNLREHLLNLKQGVDDYLIKPPDPLDLRIRIEMAIKRAQFSSHTIPLTGFPSGRIIEQTLHDKLIGTEPFTFGYIDIDNFKFFNDVYGYVLGDRIIMQTAYMLYKSVKKFGGKGDFIGHIGGDDFVFVTTPAKAVNIAKNFICMFDNIIPFHYNQQDRQQGFIVARDRMRNIRKTPLMSVSLALVNRNNVSDYRSIVQINEKIAEIKHYLKVMPGSKFMADRRTTSSDNEPAQVYNKRESILNSYRPLGQILTERGIINNEQLDEALVLHWKRDIPLGDILKEMELVNKDQLEDALKWQHKVIDLLVESENANIKFPK